MTTQQREQMDLELGVASWPAAGQRPVPARPDPERPDGAPAWYRGEEAESQAFLKAMGIELE